MYARLALVAGFVSLLATAAGCARPDVVPVATPARTVPAYRLQAVGPTGLEPAQPFAVAAASPPAALPTATRDRAPSGAIRGPAVVRFSPPPMMMRVSATPLDGSLRDHRR
jgi:hypothetical protein